MRYFFDIQRDGEFLNDDEGIELGTIEEVHQEVLNAAREMVSQSIRFGSQPDLKTSFEVRDEMGSTIFSMPLLTLVLMHMAQIAKP